MRLALPLAVLSLLVIALPVSAAPRPSKNCDFLDPNVCLYPFPNDFFRKNGRISFAKKAMPGDKDGKRIAPGAWNRNDGFSPGQTILTHVRGLDLEKTGAVMLRDLSRFDDRKAPIVVINARTRRRHLIFAELDPHPKRARDVALQIRPATNWEEGERYIVALRNLKNGSGKRLKAGAAFRLYRDRTKTDNPLVEGRRKHMDSLFKTLRRAGIRRGDLYLAWDFTVASEDNLTERAVHMRDMAFEALGDADLANGVVEGSAPAFTVTKNEVVSDEPGVARRIEGTYTVPCFLDKPDCGPGAGFAYESTRSNLPEWNTANVRTAPFYCNVPSAANPGKRALAVQYGHGLLGSGQQVFDEPDIQDMAEEHNAMYCATNWTGMDNPSIPFAVEVLKNLSLFPKFADRLQQGMLDQMFLGRLMVHPQGLAVDPAFQQGNKPYFDNSTLYYDSNSQGGIMGGALTALTPDFENAVLGVPGMNYSVLLRRSVDFDNYATIMYRQYPNQRERPLVLGLMQMLWDRGENNGYAHHIVGDPLPGSRDHRVLLHPAVGDHQVTTIANDMLARTVGAQVRQPALHGGRSLEKSPLFGIPAISGLPFTGRAALVYWDTGPVRTVAGQTEGTPPAPLGEVPQREGRDPHAGPRRSADGRRQKVEWLTNSQLIDVCGAEPCHAFGWEGP